MPRWHSRSISTLYLTLKLKSLVSWESPGRYFMIGRCCWELFEVLSCRSWSTAVLCSAADSHLKFLDWVIISASFLTGDVLRVNLAHRQSVAVLCMLSRIGSNSLRPQCGALPLPYVPMRVTPGALVVHRHSFAPPRCRTAQYCRTSVPLSVAKVGAICPSLLKTVGAGLVGFEGPKFHH